MAAAITNVSPSAAGPVTTITITGSGFTDAVSVLFGGVGTALPIIISDTQILVSSPASPFLDAVTPQVPETVDVQVLNSDSSLSPLVAADEFTFLAPPVLYSVVPYSGLSGATVPVTIYGTNLQFPISAVTLGPYASDPTSFVASADGTSATGLLTLTGILGNSYALQVTNAAGPSAYKNPLFVVSPGAALTVPPATALDDALSGRYGPVAIRYRYEQRDYAGNFIADLTAAVNEGASIVQTTAATGNVSGGSGSAGCIIHLDNTQPVARTAQFVFGNPELLPASFTIEDPATFNVMVWAVVSVLGVDESIPMGLFHLDAPTRIQYANGSEEWNALGSDLTYILANRTTPGTYTIPAGTPYLAAVGNFCRAFGLKEAISTLTLPAYLTPVDVIWTAGTTYLQIINDVLYGLNLFPIWADAQGVMQTRYRNDPATEQPAVAYSTAQEPRLLVAPTARSQNIGSLLNQVAVAIDDPLRTPATATATNNDPASPLSVTSSQKLNFKAIAGNSTPSTNEVYNATLCAAIADFEVRDQACMAVSRQLETVPDPRRGNRETYLLTMEDYEVQTLWRCRSFDYTCAPGGPHLHVVERAAELVVTGS